MSSVCEILKNKGSNLGWDNDRSDAADFGHHKQDSSILLIGHLHQILKHLRLNQCHPFSEEILNFSYLHMLK